MEAILNSGFFWGTLAAIFAGIMGIAANWSEIKENRRGATR